MLLNRRAVVTGLGILAPNGKGTEAFWTSLLQARSGIAPITLFDASQLKTRFAGEVKDFDPSSLDSIVPLRARRLARHTQLALAATRMATTDAGLDPKTMEFLSQVPVVIGVSSSGIDVIEGVSERLRERGPHRVGPYGVGYSQPHAVATAMIESLEFRVQSKTISTACQAGLDAIAAAAALIRSGKADLAIAGGADAPITPLTCASFCCSGLLSTRNDEPEKASRPFDRDRDGGVMAEGAGIVILEELTHALARGARPYLEITGYGSSVDPRGEVDASGMARAMTTAILNAGRHPDYVDYTCAHGPSDPTLDRVETAMIKEVFGDRKAYRTPVSSIKGVTGNPLAAAGPFELAACALAMRDGLVPPTANYETPDPGCDLDYVPNEPRAIRVRCAILNVHALGRSNGSLLVERVET